MDTAKVFMSGRSQAVRLPKEYRFATDEVIIRRTAEGILLVPKTPQKLGDALASAFDQLDVGDDETFERPPQGEFERPADLFEGAAPAPKPAVKRKAPAAAGKPQKAHKTR